MPYPYDDEVLPGEGGLLGRINTGLNSALGRFGASLLGDYGSGPEPRNVLGSIGKAGLVAGTAQREAMETNYMRERMLAAQRERQQQQQLQQLIASGKIAPPAGMDPDQFAAAFGAAPEAFTKAWATSIFPQKYDPATEVEILKIRSAIAKEEQLARSAKTEAEAGETAEETKLASAGSAIKSITGAGTRLSKRNSPLAPGSTVAGYLEPIVKGAGLIPGGPEVVEKYTGASQADVVDRETLRKNAAALVNTLTPMAQSSGSGGSVLGLQLAEQASANLDLQWETIRRILIQNTTQAIREAERKGVTIPDESELRQGLAELQAQDKAFTDAGGKVNQAAVDNYTPTDEAIAKYAKDRGLSIGVGPDGKVSTQPAGVYGPEEGGDVEIPPTDVPPPAAPVSPAAPAAVPPGLGGGFPSFSNVPSFADLFGGAKAAVEGVPAQAADVATQVKQAVEPIIQKVQTVDIPGAVQGAYNQAAPYVKNEVQQRAADARPLVHQAIAAARDAGDKVAAVGNEVYALSGRKLGPVVNGVLEVSRTDKNLAREAVRKGYAKFVKIGTKYYRWRD